MRQRHHEEQSRQPGEGPENPGDDGTTALHAQSQHFLNIGNQIIQSALSGNSQDFLAASRQQGGQ